MKFGQGGTPQPRYLMRCQDREYTVKKWPLQDVEDISAFNNASTSSQQQFVQMLKLIKLPPSNDKKNASKDKAAGKKADHEHILSETQRLIFQNDDEELKPDVVFVCIDVEAIELSPHPISEVGISIADMEELRMKTPGEFCRSWWPFISSHHLRTHEYSGLVNRQFITGCPDNFDFG